MYYPMYYIPMTQPKLPPISLRLAPDVLAAVDMKAGALGLTRHAALVQAVGAWVCGPVEVTAPGPAVVKVVLAGPKASAFPRPAYGSRLKKPK